MKVRAAEAALGGGVIGPGGLYAAKVALSCDVKGALGLATATEQFLSASCLAACFSLFAKANKQR